MSLLYGDWDRMERELMGWRVLGLCAVGVAVVATATALWPARPPRPPREQVIRFVLEIPPRADQGLQIGGASYTSPHPVAPPVSGGESPAGDRRSYGATGLRAEGTGA